MTSSYTERYVSFIDILGFQDLVSHSVGPNASVTVDQIRSILDLPDPAGEDKIVLGRIGDISRSGHMSSAFSDCIVISTDLTEQGLMHILTHVEKIGFTLVKLGMLPRGSITRGLIYHDRQFVFGPAVNDAIKREEKEKLPRVVLTQPVIEAGQSAKEPVRSIFERYTRVDDDDSVYVNYLRTLRLIADSEGPLPEDIRDLHERIEAFTSEALTRFESDSDTTTVRERVRNRRRKYEWFRDYFHWAIDESSKDMLDRPFPG